MRCDTRPRRSVGREHRHRLRTDIFRARVCVDSAQWKVITSALGKRNVRLAGHHSARARAERGAARRAAGAPAPRGSGAALAPARAGEEVGETTALPRETP